MSQKLKLSSEIITEIISHWIEIIQCENLLLFSVLCITVTEYLWVWDY